MIYSAKFDDTLLLQYSHLFEYFSNDSYLSLLKYMSFPLLLAINRYLPIDFLTLRSLLYIISAILAFILSKNITKNNLFSSIVYLFILFMPIAFYSGNLRLYRDAIIPPFIMSTFLLLLLSLVYLYKRKFLKSFILFLIQGCIFSFTYFIKEDSLYLLGIEAVLALIGLFVIVIKKKKVLTKKNIFTITILTIIPFLCLSTCGLIYKTLNYKYFSVPDYQTRTEGEFGKFAKIVYKINSEQRKWYVWAPNDAIEKCIKYSPTLNKLNKQYDLLQTIHKYPWGKVDNNEILADFLPWLLRESLHDTGSWTSNKEINDTFKNVNNEIEKAIEDNDIQLSDRKQILSSTGGYDDEEIINVAKCSINCIWNFVSLNQFNSSFENYPNSVINNLSVAEDAYNTTHVNSLKNQSLYEEEPIHNNSFSNVIFCIYRIINISIFILFFIFLFILYRYRTKIKKSKNYFYVNLFLLLGVLFFMFSILYAFAISWFNIALYSNPDLSFGVFSSSPSYLGSLMPLLNCSAIMLLFSIFYFKKCLA